MQKFSEEVLAEKDLLRDQLLATKEELLKLNNDDLHTKKELEDANIIIKA